MDKISEEDRIKRAEEISARRNNRIPASNINIKQNKRKLLTLSKIFIQVLCSICIFGVFYFTNQNNSMAIEKIKPILSEDTDFGGIFNQINNFIKNISSSINKDIQPENVVTNDALENNLNDENVIQENTVLPDESNISTEQQNSENELITDNQNNENIESNNSNSTGGIGGGDETVETSETDQDIIFIKEQASFVKPVVGYITSGYGEREATEIISANHAGVDIGANIGTDIVASMSGTVELVSNFGDYGNHLQITNGEISTLYAHCSQIFVNEGDYIEQGQKIAEVGSTRKNNRSTFTFRNKEKWENS